MHYSEYREIDPARIDRAILDRVSEEDVVMWLAAKLVELRGATAGLSRLEFEVHHRSYSNEHYDFNCSVSGVGCHAMTHKSLASALADARLQIAKNPDDKARKHREKAARHTQLAKEYEQLAARTVASA